MIPASIVIITAVAVSPTPVPETTPKISDIPLFESGRVVVLPTVLNEILSRYDEYPDTIVRGFLIRHLGGDWEGMGEEDRQTNQYAAKNGARVLSVFSLAAFESEQEGGIAPPIIWVITEADRSVTTFLMPDDY